mgnify:CR=1 FL=1
MTEPNDTPVTPTVEATASDVEAVAVATTSDVEPAAEATTDAESSQSKPDVPYVPHVNEHVTMERPVVEKIVNQRKQLFPINMFTRSIADINRMEGTYSNFQELTDSPQGQRWVNSIMEATEHLGNSAVFVAATEREGSDWGQFLEYNGNRFMAAMPEFGGGGKKLTGKNAAMKVSGLLGLAATIQVPLWNSGIWISLLAPPDSEILMLEHQIAQDKIELGNNTAGLAFANSSVNVTDRIMQFALSKVYQSTLQNPDPSALKKLIKAKDVWTIAWALGLTIYPTGYTMDRPCVENPDNCQHVETEHLNLARLQWVDRAALTPYQKRHMADRRASYTEADVIKYQEEGRVGIKTRTVLHDKLTVVFKNPTVDDWISGGTRWIAGIEQTIETGMGNSISTTQKNDYFQQQAELTKLREYTHWIDRLVFEDDEYDDADSIEGILSSLSGDPEAATEFFKGVQKHMDDITVSIIAIPTYNCPVCQSPQTDAEAVHPELIPINPVRLFFTLAGRRTLRAKIATMNS